MEPEELLDLQRTCVPALAQLLFLPLAIVSLVLVIAGCGSAAFGIALLSEGVRTRDADWLVPTATALIAGVVLVVVGFVSLSVASRLISEGYWRDRALRKGRCPWCSYSIRGLSVRRCPECGERWDEEEE